MNYFSEHHSSVISANKLKQDRSVPPVDLVDQTEMADHVDEDVIVSFQTEQSAREDLDKKSESICLPACYQVLYYMS